jgi:hypothetical protein
VLYAELLCFASLVKKRSEKSKKTEEKGRNFGNVTASWSFANC